MPINKQTELGKINIKNDVVISMVAEAAMDCYGVVGICQRINTDKLLKGKDLQKGISVKMGKSGYEITIDIVIATGVKVTEILRSVQNKVKYIVETTLDISIGKVNIYVQDLKKVE